MSNASDHFYFFAGIPFLALAKMKYVLGGYRTPKPFTISDVERSISYSIETADSLLSAANRYAGTRIAGANVLELGPGSDLSLGMYLASRGAASYWAYDKHPLASGAPPEFYEQVRRHLKVSEDYLDTGRVRFAHSDAFDFATLPANHFDLMISNAAFEHFEDVPCVVQGLGRVMKPGGILAILIDLQTHSRWIRTQDPNNIYRYSTRLYKAFSFPAQPNRIRPEQYAEYFAQSGWEGVKWESADRNVRVGARNLHADFSNYDMTVLNSWLFARKRS